MRMNLPAPALMALLSIQGAVRAQEIAPPDARIPDGYKIIDGDIVVPEDFDEGRATYTVDLWPGGVVPYQFDANVSAALRTAMLEAMTLWENEATVDFVPRDGESDYLHIQDANFNASEGIGMAGGRHDIWISNWGNQFVMAHELAHALAYWHEQSRLDRNAFVQINWGNICQNCCSNPASCDPQFAFRSGSGAEYGPYDFDSVMHYGQCSFSCCSAQTNPCPPGTGCSGSPTACRTITVRPQYAAQWQTAIGQRDHLSDWDKRVMSFLYPRWNWVFAAVGWSGTELGSLLWPFNTFAEGYAAMPAGGTLWLLWPGTYSTGGLLDKAGMIRAPLGGAILDN
ncbi:MAG: M12 family metallopeptidase [Planctomycetota bacterium]